MSELLLTVLNMSFAASWLVLAVVLLRLVLKKAPRWIHVLLWAMVGLRLVCPFTLESALSLIPSAQVVSPQIVWDETPVIHTGIAPVDQAINPVFTQTFTPDPAASANPLQIWVAVAGMIWLVGMVAMGFYTLITYWRLRRRVKDAVGLEDNVYRSERIDTPFVLGLFRPRIYLPASLRTEDMPHVLSHERSHICRKDHWWKPIGFLLLAIHWFNPLMWLSYILLCRDIELACDEKVIRWMQPARRADYSQALLSCSVNRRSIAACPLAFGEVGLKARVKSILSYKKPGFWILLAAIVVCIAVAVCFLTNPSDKMEGPYSERVLAIGVCESNGSVMDEENEVWYYFSANKGTEVTIPGQTPLTVRVKHTKEDSFTLTFDRPLMRQPQNWERINGESTREEGQSSSQVQELEAEAGLWYELYEGDPGGSTRYTVLNVGRLTQFSGVFPWIPDMGAISETQTTMLPSFPGVTFHGNRSQVWSEGGPWGKWELFNGMPVHNVFFSDISGDGLPEVCATLSWGSGMIDTYVMVADFGAGELFMLRDRGIYDYFLQEVDHKLICTRRPYNQDEVLQEGSLQLVNAAGGSGRKLVIADDSTKDESQIGGADGPGLVVKEGNLTLEAVRYLAKKGEKLTWKDLEGYSGQDIGSGLYIMYYPIDKAYALSVSGGGPESPIMAARLGIRDTDLWVDIRTGDVAAFLLENGEAARDVLIRDAIAQVNRKEYPDGLLNGAAYHIIGSERVSGTPAVKEEGHVVKEIVYLHSMYARYAANGGTPSMVDGRYVPAVAVFLVDVNGGYTLAEYWEPSAGPNRESSIRSRFPANLVAQALDGTPYREELERQCYERVLNTLYTSGNLPDRIETLLQQIMASPAYSSAPGDYIKDHPESYGELLSYGKYTLRYCFGQFMDGGQTDLRGHIMAIACEDIMASWAEAYRIPPEHRMTGQAWFSALRSMAEELAGKLPSEQLQTQYPGGWLLLQMIT